jgi:hypothetical protein
MSLTHLEFITLPAHEQGGYVFGQGTYLASRQEGCYSVNLYYLHSFYCEMWLEQTCPDLDFFRTFTNQRCLAPYLDKLELPAEGVPVIRQPNRSI